MIRGIYGAKQNLEIAITVPPVNAVEILHRIYLYVIENEKNLLVFAAIAVAVVMGTPVTIASS